MVANETVSKNIRHFFENHWGLLLVFFVWCIASFPLFGQRFIPTHDGEFTIIRIREFSSMLAEGQLFPRWAPNINSGYGFPIFNFLYPFPHYIASLFHLIGVPLVQSFLMSLALAFLVAVVSCYFFLLKYFRPFSAVVGTIIFLTIPYWFVEIYVRGTIGEVWAIAFCICVFAAIARKRWIIVSLSVAGLILSHNILALLMLPITTVFIFLTERKAVLTVGVGILLAAYFWIPALLERSLVVGLNTVTYSDHFPTLVQLLFPSWGTGFSEPGIVAGEMSQQVGLIPLFVVVLALTSLARKKKDQLASPVKFFLFVFGFSTWLMLSISQPIWKLFPFLQYIQHPWRLLSLTMIVTPFLAAWCVDTKRAWIGLSIAIASILFSFSYMRPVTYEARSDEYYLSRREFTDGTSSMGNSLTTIWTPWKQNRPPNRAEVTEGVVQIREITSRAVSDAFDITAFSDAKVQINRLYYPGWKVWVDSLPVPILYDEKGVLTFTVKQGKHVVFAQFTETPLRTLANALSILTAIIVLGWGILRRLYARRI